MVVTFHVPALLVGIDLDQADVRDLQQGQGRRL
jgi:hypothetical protein